MPLEVFRSLRFKRDYRRLKRQGADLSKLEFVIERLANREMLDRRHMDHLLKGD
jgi:mRNA interferase YafQ